MLGYEVRADLARRVAEEMGLDSYVHHFGSSAEKALGPARTGDVWFYTGELSRTGRGVDVWLGLSRLQVMTTNRNGQPEAIRSAFIPGLVIDCGYVNEVSRVVGSFGHEVRWCRFPYSSARRALVQPYIETRVNERGHDVGYLSEVLNAHYAVDVRLRSDVSFDSRVTVDLPELNLNQDTALASAYRPRLNEWMSYVEARASYVYGQLIRNGI